MEQRRRRAMRTRYIGRVLFLALVASLLFAVIAILCVSCNFSKTTEKPEYTLTVTKNGGKYTLSKGIAVKDNVCFVSLADLSDLMGFKIMGDVNVMSAMFPNGDSAAFYVDTEIVALNGVPHSLEAPSYFSGAEGDTYVPLSFLNGTFDGITLTGVKDGQKIAYTLDVTDGFTTAFTAKNTTQPPENLPEHTATPPGSEFVADLSAYEQYMDPEDTDAYIRLINTSHPLGTEYIPDDLVDIADTRKDRAAAQMRECAAKAMEAMFIEMRANGYTDVSVTSAYRSAAYQQQLFDNSVNSFMQSYDYNTAYAKTAAQIAIPGTSEHQSGLCADLHNLPAASQAFESQEVYKWLVAHCADFGFILRYPKDKSDITGIIFEPWHYRFVGRYHARKIMQSGLCLEEYCEQNNIGLS